MPDLTSFSNGFLFLLKVARVEGVCGVAPLPLSLIAGFGQGMCLRANFPWPLHNVQAEWCPTERGTHAALPFLLGFIKAHELFDVALL